MLSGKWVNDIKINLKAKCTKYIMVRDRQVAEHLFINLTKYKHASLIGIH